MLKVKVWEIMRDILAQGESTVDAFFGIRKVRNGSRKEQRNG